MTSVWFTFQLAPSFLFVCALLHVPSGDLAFQHGLKENASYPEAHCKPLRALQSYWGAAELGCPMGFKHIDISVKI